ncbi:YPDG domain-containing protein, partial [Staphylococcus lutrae]
MKNPKKSKRLDFLPNKLNKYSIRKFTVGTASILIGSLLYLGVSNNADASELDEQAKEEIKSVTVDIVDPITETPQTNSEDATPVEETVVESQPLNDSEVETKQEDAVKHDETQSSNTTVEKDQVVATPVEESNNQTPVDNTKTQDVQPSNEVTPQDEKVTAQEVPTEASAPVEANKVSVENTVTAADNTVTAEDIPAKATKVLSGNDAQATVSYEQVKALADQMNNTPQASLLNISSRPETAYFRSAFFAADTTTTQMVRVTGENHFQKFGTITQHTFPGDFPDEGVLTAFNENRSNIGGKGALQFDQQIGFDQDFTIKLRIANNNQSNTTDSNGWGFIFTTVNGQDYLNQGGILRDRGLPNAAGFKIDTAFNNVRGTTDPLDKDKVRNLSEIGARMIGYGTFVRNDASGVTQQVGSDAIGSKDRPINKIVYAFNTPDHNDGRFHGQRLNDIILSYDAASSTLTANYAGKTWTATVDQLGLNKTEKYNFLITSSYEPNKVGSGLMRIDLNGSEITIPAAIPQADVHNPSYPGGSTKPSVAVDIQQTGDTTIPAGSRYDIPGGSNIPAGWTATVNPNTGVVTVTPPADATPGTSVDVPVTVTYPDGSTDTTTARVTVVPNDAQENTPGYNEGRTKPSMPVTVPQTGDTTIPTGSRYEIPGGSNIPAGWTATIDPNTGAVT